MINLVKKISIFSLFLTGVNAYAQDAAAAVATAAEKAPEASSGHIIYTEDDDTLEALKALGYSEKDSREALKKASGDTTQEKIRSALKNLK